MKSYLRRIPALHDLGGWKSSWTKRTELGSGSCPLVADFESKEIMHPTKRTLCAGSSISFVPHSAKIVESVEKPLSSKIRISFFEENKGN